MFWINFIHDIPPCHCLRWLSITSLGLLLPLLPPIFYNIADFKLYLWAYWQWRKKKKQCKYFTYLMSWQIDFWPLPLRIMGDSVHNKVFEMLLQANHETCSCGFKIICRSGKNIFMVMVRGCFWWRCSTSALSFKQTGFTPKLGHSISFSNQVENDIDWEKNGEREMERQTEIERQTHIHIHKYVSPHTPHTHTESDRPTVRKTGR